VTDHLAIAVDDATGFVRQLVVQGVVAPDSAPRGGPGGSQIFFFSGPDGEKLELFQDSREK
jgi:catechol 2,3-dioxygenase-like lactoylglutathione lyase family enzyme